MNKQEFPKFIQNAPHGLDKYEGKSASRVSDAIKSHIDNHNENDKIPKIIGLDGEWGSGKSNVIRILSNKFGDDYYLFEYDAWGHQEDLQRRSFLEALTTELVEKKILNGTTPIKIKCGDTKNVTWEEKLKYLLARKYETETKSYPRIGYGIIVAFFTAILLPIFNYIASVNGEKSYWSTLIVAIPLFAALLIWAIAATKNEKYRKLDFLLLVFQDKVTEGVEFETISEDEPSVSDFRKWMNDVSKALENNKKLIIVFDNMDRLPSEKVKELWSSIHTFFADSGYPNIWVIITFDRKHLANAFGNEKPEESIELTSHFINKTFPVIYRVAPPVLTDWKKIFNDFFEEAFGKTENTDKETLQRIFGIIKPHFTPRDIIAFINELVSLKRTWKDEIPLLPIAVFALKKEEILTTPVECILSGKYLKSIEKIVDNSEKFQDYIAALTYGVDLEIGKQIPLMQFLSKILKGESNQDINEYSEHKHFVDLLDEVIREINLATLDNAIMGLSKLKAAKVTITAQWNALVKLHLEQQKVNLSFKDTYKELLMNADDKNKNIFLNYLCKNFRECQEFKGNLFYDTMQALDNYINEHKLNIITSTFIKPKQVDPNVFIEYANNAKNNYKNYQIGCDNKLLNQYLISLFPSSLPKMDFIEYLVKDKTYYFDELEKRIEVAIINNEINNDNFPEMIKTYKLISKEKPLKQQLNANQVRNLINSTTDKDSESYCDLVAMGLCNKSINTPFIEGLDARIAQRLEYYNDYGSLLILSKDWASELLRKSVKIMTEKDYGTKMSLESVLPFFEEIKEAININADILLKEINRWEKYKDTITVENIESIIPKYSFYEYSCKTNNKLTTYINSIAIKKLESIPVDSLYAQRNTQTYYWFNCASFLIEGKSLAILPDNLTDFCKKIVVDIAAGTQPIPIINSMLDIIINKASKRKLQPTIKSICDGFCNKPKTISPALFIYFATNFNFVNKMEYREDAITRNILNDVITDANCLNIILDDSDGYINIINKAGDDAEDLKAKIHQLLQSNKSDKILKFATAIGIKDDDKDDHEQKNNV